MFGLIRSDESLNRQDKTSFLTQFNFYECHSLSLVQSGSPDEIIQAIKVLDIREDRLIKFFLMLRELPAKLCFKQLAPFDMTKFNILEQKQNEISFGLIG